MNKHYPTKARTLSRFSIRKCSVGTASFLIGTVAFFGIHHEAFAAENTQQPVTVNQLQSPDNEDASSTQPETNNDSSLADENATKEASASQPKDNANTQNENVQSPENQESVSNTNQAEQQSPEKASTESEQPTNSSSTTNSANATTENNQPTNSTEKQPLTEQQQTQSKASPDSTSTEKETTDTQNVNEQPTNTQTTKDQNSTVQNNAPEENLSNSSTPQKNTTTPTQPVESSNTNSQNTSTESVYATTSPTTSSELKKVKGTTKLRAVSTNEAQPVASGGSNVNDKINATDISTSETYIEPNNSGSYYLRSKFNVDGQVKSGDYFTVEMPNTVNVYGDTRFDPNHQEKIKNADGQVIALGDYDVQNHRMTYTFTDAVNNLTNISGQFNLTQFMDRKVATDSKVYPLNYKVAGESLDTQITVNYGKYYNVGDSNLKSMITLEDPKTGDYEQYIYVNPLQRKANGTVVALQSYQDDPAKSNGQLDPQNSKIQIFKVGPNDKLNDSFGVEDSQYQDVTNQFKVYYYDNGKAYINFGDLNGARYIIKVTSKEKPDSKADLNLRSSMYTQNQYRQYDRLTWDNNILKSSSSGTADGSQAVYSLGDKVWEDSNKNGIQDNDELGIPGVKVILKDSNGTVIETTETNANGKYSFDNLPNGTYKVDFETPNNYSPTTPNVGNDALDSDGPADALAIISDGNNLTVDQGFYRTEQPKYNVGDKVWEDTNKDGIQDDNEPGIANVTVTLKDADGNIIGTEVTDENGKYLFKDVTEGEYTIDFETPNGYTPTITGQGFLNNDSNGTTAKILVDDNDLTIDSGFYKVIPDEPDNPGNPDQPSPDEPDQPSPNEPNDPGNPDQPSPNQPNDPGNPDQPLPNEPNDPGNPDQPSPNEPNQPGNPDQPSPNEPNQPGNPDQPLPNEPNQPGNPNQPSPNMPNEPGMPGQHETTPSPAQHMTQSNASKHEGMNEQQKSKALPKSGQTSSNQGMLFGTLLAGLGSLFLLRKRRHRQDK
ncbi:YSIRK-type signal peptide-containing protein [Staphylococcus coagulans]|uniref:SdrD B-like domain-containing protein n=1 Tax=Staphylococcus coagulans TaxID=74706 RepID=UPI001BE5AB5C|nr:SdrD B-like domain-containing protein [Staphylococcus coagulans]MBT2856813.1 YSIRK-type signal peptide-containing protein [Staphylococcus coagulans]